MESPLAFLPGRSTVSRSSGKSATGSSDLSSNSESPVHSSKSGRVPSVRQSSSSRVGCESESKQSVLLTDFRFGPDGPYLVPVGIKSAIGHIDFWEELAHEIKTQGRGPDFITIDGAEGGTGAAPLTYADHVSLPFKIGFQRVYTLFQKEGISERIVWIGSGKLGFPDRAVVAIAMGCDLIHIAREAMLAIGCIQAQKCQTDECPAGVATQNYWLEAGLDPQDKAK